jgi:hypothetical protein
MRPKTIVLILVASLLAGCMSERIAKESLLSCEDMFGRDHENCAPYDPNEGT